MPTPSSAAPAHSRSGLRLFFVNITPWFTWAKDRVVATWTTVQEEVVPVLLHAVTPKNSDDAYRAGLGAACLGALALVGPTGLAVLVAGAAGWAFVILRLNELNVQAHIKDYADVVALVANSGSPTQVLDEGAADERFTKQYQTAWATVTIRQGSPAISDSSGVISSIQYRGVGDYTINWVKSFRDEHYGFWVSGASGSMKYELTRTGVRLLMSAETGLSLDEISVTFFAIQEADVE